MKYITQKIGIILFTLSLVMSIEVKAQNVFEEPGDDPDIPEVPLDGGLSLLIATGAVYAGNRFYQSKKDRNMEVK